MTATHPMTLLAHGVPLTLLLDLVDADRMVSRSILRREEGDAGWLVDVVPRPRCRTVARTGAQSSNL